MQWIRCSKVLLVFTVLIALFFSPAKGPAQGQDKSPPSVRVEVVGILSASQPKYYVGAVTAKETVAIVPRVSGFLKKIAFQEGSTVQKGDLLFEIEDTVYEMNVQVAKSVIDQIEAEIDLAEKDLERMTTLRSGHVVAEQELDAAKRNHALQKAKLDEAKAKLALAENDLSYTKIWSPLTGRIGAKQFSEGNYITTTSGVLATIVQYDPISVRILLSEMDFMQFFQANGEAADAEIVILRADGRPYTGNFKIDFFDNLVDHSEGTIAAYLLCDNPEAQLLPGGFAKVSLAEKFKEPIPAVNVASVMTDGKRHYVYVLGADNTVRRRDITVGPLVFDRYGIADGLVAGEQVVVGGANKVSPGVKVNPVMPKDKETILQTTGQ